MENRSNKAFVIAVVLHLVLFALLFTGYLVTPREEMPDSPPFELHHPPSEVQQQPSPVESQPRQVRQIELPRFEVEEVELPSAEPRERPQPAPEPPPEPRQPAPEPEPQYERVTINQFRAEHGTPQTPQARPQQQARPQPAPPIEAPRIDTSNIRQQLQAVVTSTTDIEQFSRLSATDQREMERYFARLRVAIERSWSKPSAATTGMSATVRFSLSAQGRITGARVVSSSGSQEFDRSIVQAFERLASFEAPPDGESYTPSLTFRVD